MSMLSGWSRSSTLDKLEDITSRAYAVAGKLGDIQDAVNREGIGLLDNWDFRRSSMKAYEIADSARAAYGSVVQGGTHIPARLMVPGAELAVKKYEGLVVKAETEAAHSGRRLYRA